MNVDTLLIAMFSFILTGFFLLVFGLVYLMDLRYNEKIFLIIFYSGMACLVIGMVLMIYDMLTSLMQFIGV